MEKAASLDDEVVSGSLGRTFDILQENRARKILRLARAPFGSDAPKMVQFRRRRPTSWVGRKHVTVLDYHIAGKRVHKKFMLGFLYVHKIIRCVSVTALFMGE